MIIFEDKEFEQSVLNDGCIAVPFEVISGSNGIDLLVYSFCRKIAEEFEERFLKDPFSNEARTFLYTKLEPIMKEMEFECGGACERITLSYKLDSAEAVNSECINGKAQLIDRLTQKDIADSDTDLFDFTLDPDDEYDRMAVIRGERGEIAAFAAVNDIICEGSETDCGSRTDIIELNVECAEKYRGRGYGSECVAVLAEYLLGKGAAVSYICGEENIPSIKTAEKVGFKLCERRMPFVCYRRSEDGTDTVDIED